jgi:glycosyltransferase involved in cell wall biosynthesis
MGKQVNSAQYWENRFATGDWAQKHGEGQTRFFGKLALQLLPPWVLEDIRKHRRALCDVGCAEGAACEVWAEACPEITVSGVDFSAAAVARASDLHPNISFFHGDLDAAPPETEVVFCSNVLEHLSGPEEHLKKWASRPNVKHLIVLVPLHETNRHFEHLVTLDYNNFPLKLGALLLSAFQEIDLRGTPDEAQWYGKQALVVYSHDTIAQTVASGLHDLLGPAMRARGDLEQAKKALAQAQAEQRLRLAELSALQRRFADTLTESRQTERTLTRTETELKSLEFERQREHQDLKHRVAEAERAHQPLRASLEASESRLATLNNEMNDMRSSLKWKVAFAVADSAHSSGAGPFLRLWKVADTHGIGAALQHVGLSVRKRVDALRRVTPHDFNPYAGLRLLKPLPVEVIDDPYRGSAELPAFSIVTTVRNEEKNLVRFLTSIAAQRLKPAEVIVVDGGSTDDTVGLLHEFAETAPFPVNVIAEGKCNIAAGRNRGLKAATHDVVVFIDAGCALKADFFSAMVGPFTRSGDVDLVGGIYVASPDAPFASAFIADWARCDFSHFLPSARAVAVRRGMAMAMGGFPEHLTHTGEDTLFDVEYRRASRRWVFNRAAIVEWNGPPNAKAQLKLSHSYSRGDGESGLGDWRFYNQWSAKRRHVLAPLNELDTAALDGYLDGRKLRARAVFERRSLRGVVFVFDAFSLTHRGGDHRLTQLTLELTRQGFKVVHVSAAAGIWPSGKPVYFNVDPTLLELYQVNDFDVKELCRRYGSRTTGIVIGSPHPALVDFALELNSELPQAPLLYDVTAEVAGPGQPAWYQRSTERELVKAARLVTVSHPSLKESPGLSAARDLRVISDGFDDRLHRRSLAPMRPQGFPPGKTALCVIPPGMELVSHWLERVTIAHPEITFLVAQHGAQAPLPYMGKTLSNLKLMHPSAPHELAAYLAHAHVMLVPARLPPQGLVAPSYTWLWQALAMGTPVVASDTLRPETLAERMWWAKDADSFEEALIGALGAPAPPGLSSDAMTSYTWQTRAHEFLGAFFDVSRA